MRHTYPAIHSTTETFLRRRHLTQPWYACSLPFASDLHLAARDPLDESPSSLRVSNASIHPVVTVPCLQRFHADEVRSRGQSIETNIIDMQHHKRRAMKRSLKQAVTGMILVVNPCRVYPWPLSAAHHDFSLCRCLAASRYRRTAVGFATRESYVH